MKHLLDMILSVDTDIARRELVDRYFNALVTRTFIVCAALLLGYVVFTTSSCETNALFDAQRETAECRQKLEATRAICHPAANLSQ